MIQVEKQAPLGTGAILNGIAYYCDTIEAFLLTKGGDILDRLLRATPMEDLHLEEQKYAWREEIRCLQARLKELGAKGFVVFEYNIVRMAKRIDVVLLLRNVVYSLEFKVGQKYAPESIEQALDYALRLRSFHKMSQDMYICPVLIATEENDSFFNPYEDGSKTIGLQKTNDKKLGQIIERIDKAYGCDDDFDFNRWFYSEYHPSPSIVEAAVDAFNSVPVSSIAHSEAGQEGIDSCVASVNEVIEYAKREKKKCLCFVTGVPGAGKTLVGLDIAAQHSDIKDDLYSVYISGNGPLVDVLQEALAKAWLEAERVKSKAEGRRKASALIQDAYEFRNHYLNSPETPYEKILIFDEAQRVWNKEKVDNFYLERKKGDETTLPNASEAELAIRFMDRHKDWAVIVCLVGLGQDIHNGETGVFGWFHAILDRYHDWEAFYSPFLFGSSVTDEAEKLAISSFPGSKEVPGLHLKVSVRSFRAEKVSSFVNDLVDGNGIGAKETLPDIQGKYPIYVTRDLETAKRWLRDKKVGSQRIGMIASSAAKDSVSNGIDVPGRFFTWPDWFLKSGADDPSSSNSLSFAASEFNIQGLEIDWALVYWGADFRYEEGGFIQYVLHYRRPHQVWDRALESRFRNSTAEEKARWIRNAYRVNLTRARQGMVIYVPYGSDDPLDVNYHGNYDGVYEYLTKEIGLPTLDGVVIATKGEGYKMAGPDMKRIQEKLLQLKTLYESGALSEKDYESRKSMVLDNWLQE